MGGASCRRRQQRADVDPHDGHEFDPYDGLVVQDAAVQTTPEPRSTRPEPRSTRPEPRSTRPELRSTQRQGGADAWARFTRRLQRLAYKRRAWAFLGHLLRDIKDRGRR